MTKSNVE